MSHEVVNNNLVFAPDCLNFLVAILTASQLRNIFSLFQNHNALKIISPSRGEWLWLPDRFRPWCHGAVLHNRKSPGQTCTLVASRWQQVCLRWHVGDMPRLGIMLWFQHACWSYWNCRGKMKSHHNCCYHLVMYCSFPKSIVNCCSLKLIYWPHPHPSFSYPNSWPFFGKSFPPQNAWECKANLFIPALAGNILKFQHVQCRKTSALS